MKKLMIVAVALMAAVATQAASISWSTGKGTVLTKAGTALSEGSIYLVNADSAVYATLIADLTSGKVTAANISENAAYVGTSVTGSGSKKAGLTSGDGANSDFTSGTSYKLAYLVFDKDATDGKDYFYVSSTATGKAWSTGEEKALATAASWTTGSAAGTWTQVAPEPTSGLLLLIGMAGLALKRKRA